MPILDKYVQAKRKSLGVRPDGSGPLYEYDSGGENPAGEYAGMPPEGEVLAQMLAAMMQPVDGTNSSPPLDPDPERGAGDQPAGGAFDPVQMSGVAIELLGKSQKEEDGTPPSPPTQTTYERFQQEVGQFEEEKDANFLEDNWGKLLTVMAGTALQMVGVHNKNAPMFMGGNALAQLGGAAMSDYFGTKENEQQALYDKYTKESGSPRDVAAVMAMARDHYERTGEAPSMEKAMEFIGLYDSISEEQGAVLVKEMMAVGNAKPGPAAGQMIKSMQGSLTSVGKEFLNKPENVDLPDERKRELLDSYLRDEVILGMEGDIDQETRAGMRTDEVLGNLDSVIEDIISGSESGKAWGTLGNSGATVDAVLKDTVTVNEEAILKYPLLHGLDHKKATLETIGQVFNENLVKVTEDNSVFNPSYDDDGYLYINVSEGGTDPSTIRAGEGVMGGGESTPSTKRAAVKQIRILADPIDNTPLRATVAKGRLESVKSGSTSLLHQDIIDYWRKMIQEVIVK